MLQDIYKSTLFVYTAGRTYKTKLHAMSVYTVGRTYKSTLPVNSAGRTYKPKLSPYIPGGACKSILSVHSVGRGN